MKYISFIIIALTISSTQQEMFAQSGWTLQQDIPGPHIYYSVYFVNQSTGFAVGEIYFGQKEGGLIIKTTNSGNNWFMCYYDTSFFDFRTVYFIDQQTGWVGGLPNSILKTTNGGNNWFSQGNGGLFWATCISFVNANTGWVVGDTLNASGIIMKTSNGGNNWVYQNSGTTYGLTSVSFINENTGWVAGVSGGLGGIIIKTTNGGTNWFTQYQDVIYNNLFDINFVNSNTGWVYGLNTNGIAKIVKTTNGGNNWFLEYSTPHFIYSLYFVNENLGWIGGYNYSSGSGFISNTTDGGINWSEHFLTGANKSIYSFNFINTTTGWAVGNGGIIFNTTNGGNPIGISPISTEIPNQFSLSQNYPNPFNPNSKIKFQMSKLSQAKLVVFDILGREVTTLVNEELKPGTYEVVFDGTNYPSGVYYYKLTAGDYAETKKMVLMK